MHLRYCVLGTYETSLTVRMTLGASSFYTIDGPQVEAIRGKTTKGHIKGSVVRDEGAKMQVTNQDLTMDVTNCGGREISHQYLLAIRTAGGVPFED
jgi:hypothetical protein